MLLPPPISELVHVIVITYVHVKLSIYLPPQHGLTVNKTRQSKKFEHFKQESSS